MNFGGLRFKLFQLFAICVSWIPSPRKKKYELVLVRADALGDYVIWHDALQAYKEKFQNKKVLLICPSIDKQLACGDSFFSAVIDFNGKSIGTSFGSFFRFFIKCRAIESDVVIYPVWERHVIGDFVVSTIKSNEKIGMIGIGKHDFWWNFYNRKYTRLLENPQTNNEICAIEYFTQKVINPNYKYGYNKLEVTGNHSVVEYGKFALIAISSSVSKKIWEVEKFIELIDKIPSDYNILLSGAGDNDINMAQVIINGVSDKKRVYNLINKTSIIDLVSIISKAKFVVGNDSAAVHIAAATHVPSICIFHGAHFGRFLPYPNHLPNIEYNPHTIFAKMPCFGCGYKCTQQERDNYECLHRVSVDMVRESLKYVI